MNCTSVDNTGHKQVLIIALFIVLKMYVLRKKFARIFRRSIFSPILKNNEAARIFRRRKIRARTVYTELEKSCVCIYRIL